MLCIRSYRFISVCSVGVNEIALALLIKMSMPPNCNQININIIDERKLNEIVHWRPNEYLIDCLFYGGLNLEFISNIQNAGKSFTSGLLN